MSRRRSRVPAEVTAGYTFREVWGYRHRELSSREIEKFVAAVNAARERRMRPATVVIKPQPCALCGATRATGAA